MREIEVLYGVGQDVGAWAADHAVSLVPSRWPYGLDQLAAGLPTALAQGEHPGRLGRAWSMLRSDDAAAETGRITWDENVAAGLAPRAGASRHSGVIWLTDQAAAGKTVGRRVAWLRRFTSLWVLSAAQVVPLRELLGPRGPRVSVVPFGVDAEFFAARAYPLAPLVLSIGGDRDRDTATLFRALSQVLASAPGTEVVVQTSSSLEPPPGIIKVGRLSHADLRELYTRASVVTIATRPNLHVSGMTVSLEAMATGRPVVITGTPGMADYVRDDRTGVVVAPGDADALARETTELLRDVDRAQELGRAGRGFVEAGHTTSTLCAGILDAVRPSRA
ncbi:hypothetical protein BH11ACT1_BH11ACT1_12800 [soil metagenome]